MKRIGFSLSHSTNQTDEEQPEILDEEGLITDSWLEKALMEHFDPPQWEIDYRKSLFWAAIFNTHNKEHKC
jgi:hypothetical protein